MQEDMDLMYLGKKFVDKAHRYIDESLRIYGITMSQFSILMYIRENYANAVSLKDIAEHFDLSHVTVIGILRRMEKNGKYAHGYNFTLSCCTFSLKSSMYAAYDHA